MSETDSLTWGGKLVATWGILGVLALLSQAIFRLAPLAIEPVLDGSMTAFHWFLYGAWTLFNAYAEGYRGFQKNFSPRVVARAMHLGKNPKPLHVLVAPVFCMAFFHAKRRNLFLAWGLLTGIVLLVIAVRMLPQPWRGIVDVGVVVGLVWGVLSVIVLFARAMFAGVIPPDNSLPETAPASP